MANKWVYMFSEGDMTMRNLLGGKGANLAEMTSIGLPVPQGFTITTEACTQYYEDGRKINDEIMAQVMDGVKKMEELKFKYRPFDGEADVWTEETYDTALLCVCRKSGNEMVTGIFNFSNEDRTAWIDMGEFTWKDLFTGEKRVLRGVPVPARGYAWYYRKWD